MAAQARDEGLRLPCAERGMGAIPFTLGGPTGSLCQLGISRGLIDEDQPRQCFIEERLAPVDPQITGTRDVRSQLLGGEQSFFYG